MAAVGADPERLLARLNAQHLILQALCDRLVACGVLEIDDLRQVNRSADSRAERLTASGDTWAQVRGGRVKEAIAEFFKILPPPPV
jgi:hypothetical protein